MISSTVSRGHCYYCASYKNIIQSFFLASSCKRVSDGGNSWTLQNRPTRCQGESSFCSWSVSKSVRDGLDCWCIIDLELSSLFCCWSRFALLLSSMFQVAFSRALRMSRSALLTCSSLFCFLLFMNWKKRSIVSKN